MAAKIKVFHVYFAAVYIVLLNSCVYISKVLPISTISHCLCIFKLLPYKGNIRQS